MAWVEQWVGHNTTTRDDAIWAAAYSDDGEYLAIYGPRTGDRRSSRKKFMTSENARIEWRKKVEEKQGRGYAEAEFDSPFFLVPSFEAVPMFARAGRTATGPDLTTQVAAILQATSKVEVSWAQLQTFQFDPGVGVVEVVTGRPVVAGVGGEGGIRVLGVDGARLQVGCAHALEALGVNFALKGRLLEAPGRGAELVVEDALEWEGVPLAGQTYVQRLEHIRREFSARGLWAGGAPTVADARAMSQTEGLLILEPAFEGAAFGRVVNEVFGGGGIGVELRWRELTRTQDNWGVRFSFRPRVACRAYAVDDHGGLLVGLHYRGDGDLVGVGRVGPEPGLETQFAAARDQIIKGSIPVVDIEYLQVGSHGVHLVSPKFAGLNLTAEKGSASILSQLSRRGLEEYEADQVQSQPADIAIA